MPPPHARLVGAQRAVAARARGGGDVAPHPEELGLQRALPALLREPHPHVPLPRLQRQPLGLVAPPPRLVAARPQRRPQQLALLKVRPPLRGPCRRRGLEGRVAGATWRHARECALSVARGERRVCGGAPPQRPHLERLLDRGGRAPVLVVGVGAEDARCVKVEAADELLEDDAEYVAVVPEGHRAELRASGGRRVRLRGRAAAASAARTRAGTRSRRRGSGRDNSRWARSGKRARLWTAGTRGGEREPGRRMGAYQRRRRATTAPDGSASEGGGGSGGDGSRGRGGRRGQRAAAAAAAGHLVERI